MKPVQAQFIQRIVWALCVAMMVACSWLTQLDSTANQLVDAGLKRALLSFASARVLNAVISVAQGTEVAFEPGGVGVVFTPGQVLDPVNDLVEQFSNLMLMASVSFGVQKMLMTIGANWTVSLCLTVTAFGWIFFYLRRHPIPAWLSRMLVILLMIRFALPVVTVGTDMLFQKFMSADYQSSQQSISAASGRLSDLTPPVAATNENQGVLNRIKDWWAQKTDVKTRFDQLKQAAENATEHIVNLIVIFLLQTLVIPLLMLWILYGLVRRAFERPTRISISTSSQEKS